MRVGVVNLVPTPYREPLYEALSQRPGITLRVFYLQPRDSLRGWSSLSSPYDALTLKCLTPESLYPLPVVGVVNPGLIGHLRRFSPDCVVVHGYSYLSQMQVLRWAIRHRTPYFLWADSNSHKIGRRGPIARSKEICLRYFCRHAAGVLTIGTLNERFWRHYGVEADRQFRSPLAVDNEYFRTRATIWRREKASCRKALGLPSGRLLLYVGRLAPEKNLGVLLRALSLYREEGGPPLSLAIVGDGSEKARLARLLRELGLNNVFQFGFQAQSELPRFYGIADALVLPSREEPWGLVVNEAMAAGLPVLLSKSTGCLPDLLDEERNGFSFDETDVRSVSRCLERFCSMSDEQVLRMGARSAELVSSWSFSNALAGIYRALDSVTAAMDKPSLSPAR